MFVAMMPDETRFLALAGYIYLLAQLRQRAQYQWPDAWPRA